MTVEEARKFKDSSKSFSVTSCKDETVIKCAAFASVQRLGGSVDDKTSVLGQYEVQFGIFREKTFKWLVEYLQCKVCRKKFASWSQHVLSQLEMGRRSFFPAILTYRYLEIFRGNTAKVY